MVVQLRLTLSEAKSIMPLMKKIPWARFEMLAERLVEGSFRRLFGGQLEPMEVAYQLARALDDAQARGIAANYFAVRLHPDDLETLTSQRPNLAADLGETLIKLAQQAGMTLPADPQVVLVADPNLGRQRVKVKAHREEQSQETTRVYRVVDSETAALDALLRLDAYLVIDGRRHLPLHQPVVSLGRRTDNDVVLDSPAVSRQHAQLRWRYGRFILHNLSRRGRTLVNGEPISQQVLRPGDVITLSHIKLIYGEGDTGARRPARPDESQNEDAGEDDNTRVMPKSS